MGGANNASGKQPKKLSRTLFQALFALACASVIITTAVAAGVFFAASEQQAESTLLNQAQDLAQAIDAEPADMRTKTLQDQHFGQTRITYIASDGTVILDTAVDDVASEENHAQRPEIIAAASTGSGVVARMSNTLGSDTLYAAVQLSDGSFIRLGENRYAVQAILGATTLLIIVLLVLLLTVGAFIASKLAERVTAPLNSLDIDAPDADSTYAEIRPLIDRIDQQQSALKRQNDDLARANNLRQEFSNNVTHEMKTPLHVIAGYSELLRDGAVSANDVAMFADKIHQETESLSGLVDDVLVLSRLDERVGDYGELELVNVCQAIERAAKRLEDLAAKQDVSLHLELMEESVYVCTGKRLLDDIFGNLIKNAINYNVRGGSVCVSVAVEGADVVVTVADTGQGIAPEDLPRIFERFYRVDTSRSKQTGGTGLGLAIVKHAVQAANGTIDVQSELGSGSTFTVVLPTATVE